MGILNLCVGCVMWDHMLYAHIEIYLRGNAYVGLSFIVTVLVAVPRDSKFNPSVDGCVGGVFPVTRWCHRG